MWKRAFERVTSLHLLYIYKAATKDKQIVTNRVEELNKFVLLKKLKNSKNYQIKQSLKIKSNKNSKSILSLKTNPF